jgi:GxxExxY protein
VAAYFERNFYHRAHGAHGVDFSDVTGSIIGAAIEVHRQLGPGLLESSYEACLCYELSQSGILFERQKALPLIYKGERMDCGYRMDLVVSDAVVVELKSVDRIERIHVATVLTYLKLSKYSVALLINFHATTLKDGIRRLVL